MHNEIEEEEDSEEPEEEQSSETNCDADVTMQVRVEDYDPEPGLTSSRRLTIRADWKPCSMSTQTFRQYKLTSQSEDDETTEDDDMPSLCSTDESENGAESLPKWYEEEVPVLDKIEEHAQPEAEPAQTEQSQAQLYNMKTTLVPEPALADSSWQGHAHFPNKMVEFPASMKGYKAETERHYCYKLIGLATS